MYYANEITRIYKVDVDHEVRPVGPVKSRPLVMRLSMGGSDIQKAQRISQDAALELMGELQKCLKAIGVLPSEGL